MTLAELLAAYPPGNRTPLENALVKEVERLRAEDERTGRRDWTVDERSELQTAGLLAMDDITPGMLPELRAAQTRAAAFRLGIRRGTCPRCGKSWSSWSEQKVYCSSKCQTQEMQQRFRDRRATAATKPPAAP